MRKAVTLLALIAAASAAQAQNYNDVWVASPNDVWAVGNNGVVGHGSSASWTTVNTNVTSNLRSVWGSAANDIWMVGEGGVILRWNGTGVTRSFSPMQADWIAVNGCGANDVWILGNSEDNSQPVPVFRWNGSQWTPQHMPFAFRAADLQLVCIAGAGAGGGGPVVAGVAYFDPRPTERRAIGVLARFQGGRWTTQGWNGRAMMADSATIGAHGWSHVSVNGGVTLLAGGDSGNVVMVSNRTGSGWTRLPPPPGEFQRAFLTGDGSPVLVMEDGFARFAAGRWRMIGPPQRQAVQSDTAEMERIRRRMDVLGEQIQRSGTPTAAQIQEISQLQMRFVALQTGQNPNASMQQVMQGAQAYGAQAQADANRQITLQFGTQPGVFAPRTGTDFYVVTQGGSVMHVTGDNSRVVHSQMCAMQPTLCGR